MIKYHAKLSALAVLIVIAIMLTTVLASCNRNAGGKTSSASTSGKTSSETVSEQDNASSEAASDSSASEDSSPFDDSSDFGDIDTTDTAYHTDTPDYVPTDNDNPFTYDTGSAKPEVTLDGNLSDSQWKGLSELTIGEGNIGKVKAFYGKDGIYVGAEITDNNIWQGKSNIYDNTSFEIYLDTKGDGGSSPDSDNIQIFIATDERVLVRRGVGGMWTDTSIMKQYAVNVNGTANNSNDTDKGYTVEAFIPYSQLGGVPTDDYGIVFGIVKCDSNGNRYAWSGISGVNVQVPDLYYKLRHSDNQIVKAPKKNLVDAGMTLDGKDDESVWQGKEYYAFGNGAAAAVKTYSGKNGLYFYFKVKDKSLFTPNLFPYQNDSVEIYMDTSSNGGNSPLRDDYQVRADSAGNIQFFRGNGSGWDESVNNVLSGSVVNGTVNNGSDVDTGYNIEVFVPWSDLNSETALSTMKLNFGLCNNSEGGMNVSWSGTGGDPQVPDTYIPYTAQGGIAAELYTPVDPEIALDGSLSSAKWNTGIDIAGGAATVKWFWTEKGAYIGFSVKDTAVWAKKANTYENDAVEIYLDYNNDGGDPKDDDRTIIVDAVGNILTRKGMNDNGVNRYLDFAAPKILCGTKVNGTLNDNTADTGYNVEVFIPWTEFGSAKVKPEKMGIALGLVSRNNETDPQTWQAGLQADVQNPATYYMFTEAAITKQSPSHNVAPSELSIDGLGDDTQWSGKGYFPFGRDNSTGRIKTYFGENGIYFMVKVSDGDVWGDSNDAAVDQDDAVQFYIRTNIDNTTGNPTSDDYQIRINANGDYLMLKGKGAPDIWEDYAGIVQIKSIIHGTVNDASDIDQGFDLEAYLPWSEIGGKKDSVKIGIGTREDFNGGNAEIWWGTPNGVNIQNPNNYLLLNSTSIGGQNFADLKGDIAADAGIKIDGVADEAVYTNAQNHTYGKAGNTSNTKIGFGDNGLYLFFNVSDTKVSRYSDIPPNDDGVEFRLDSNADGKFDNNDLWVRAGTEGVIWVCRSNVNTFLPIYLKSAFKINGTINNNTDTDTGYSYEMFIPYELIGGKTSKVGLDAGIFDSDAPNSNSWLHNDICDFNNPATYPRYSTGIQDEAVKIDGISDEPVWSDKAEFSYGLDNAAKVKSYISEKGLYFFMNIADKKIWGLNTFPFQNDSVELYIDTASDGGSAPQTDDFQARIDVAGNVQLLRGTGSGWTDASNNIIEACVINGTINDNADMDTGYAIEAFIPWSDMNVTNAPSSLRVNYGLCNNTDGTTGISWSGTGKDPQVPNTYLMLNATGTKLPSELSIDAATNDTAWNGRGYYSIGRDLSTGNVTSYFGNNGLYFMFRINCGDIWAGANDPDMVTDDSVQIYMRTNSAETSAVPVSGDYQIRISANGKYLAMQGNGNPGGWNNVSPYFEIASKIRGTVNDSSDVDSGYDLEVYIPWSEIGGVKDNVKIGFGTVENYGNKAKYIWWGTPNGVDIQNPNNYMALNNNSIGGVTFASLPKYIAPDSGMKIDGKADEAIYANASSHNYGIGNNSVNAKIAYGTSGLYLSFDVKDKFVSRYSLVAGGPVELPVFDDGLEFRLISNTSETAFSNNDLWVRLGLEGVQWVCRGANDNPKGMVNLDMASTIKGTLNNTTDTDTGYTYEVFIPYDYIGGKTTKVGLDVGIFNTDILQGGASAWVHNGIIDFGNPQTYPVYDAAQLPEAGMTIDGVASEALWQGKTTFAYGNAGNATVKSHIGTNGIYLFINVADSKIWASNPFPGNPNDSVEIYIDSLKNGGTKPQTDDTQIRVDADGNVFCLKGNGNGWNNYLNQTVTANAKVTGSFNDNGSDDSGYTIEVFLPWAFMGLTQPTDSVKVAFGLVNTDDGSNLSWFGGAAGGSFNDPQIPDTYGLLTAAGIQ